MAKPWTKKNPLLSMMLSGANAWAGAVRGVITGQAKRQQAATARQGAKPVTAFWTVAMTGASSKRRSRKKQS